MAAIVPMRSIRPDDFATVAGTGHKTAGQFTAHRLTTIIALLAAVVSIGGLLLPHLYRDNTFLTSAWKGTDLVTLVVGAAFNAFFLVYTALVALSILALVFGLAHADVENVSRVSGTATPVKWISGYMLLLAAALSAVYFFQSFPFIVTGRLAAIVVSSGHPTSVVFALDPSLVVPGLVLGAAWLWNRRPWSDVLAGALNVKGAVYTFALAVASIWAAAAGVPGASDEVPLWLLLCAGALPPSAFLLGNMRGDLS
jgi:hypothetical protein